MQDSRCGLTSAVYRATITYLFLLTTLFLIQARKQFLLLHIMLESGGMKYYPQHKEIDEGILKKANETV